MSNRYIPYGYQFQAGQPVPHLGESEIVREIFERYCAGDSLKLIADDLTYRQIEYSPGKTSWDKARIKRILENSRYIGSDEYPVLVPKEQFVAANVVTELEQLKQRLKGIESQEKERKITDERMEEINGLLEQFAQGGMQYDDVLTRRLISTVRVESAEEIEITFRDGRTRTEHIE